MNTSAQIPMSVKSIRYTGLLYLLVILLAGFSQGYVRANLFIPGDAVATAGNILDNPGLFRMGLVADLLAFLIDAIISVIFYRMLKPYGKSLALISSVLRLLAHPAIGSLNLLNHFMALQVMTGGTYLETFEPAQLESLSTLFMEAHRYGYMIAGAFFGLHCMLLGILLRKSRIVPGFIAAFMIVAGMGYWLETFGNFLVPGHEVLLAWIVGLAAALGEVELTLYMLIKGTCKTYAQALQNSKL